MLRVEGSTSFLTLRTSNSAFDSAVPFVFIFSYGSIILGNSGCGSSNTTVCGFSTTAPTSGAASLIAKLSRPSELPRFRAMFTNVLGSSSFQRN
ncbi:hypothetical protein BT93_J0498 [Corymbia citriodora subsp. variegata]|nr:hypothetical protein BT93_J0498 [Corymbia citriodora subsp. variegata]